MNFADYDVAELKGVGPAAREKLARLGINTFLDILFHLPNRYEDRTRIKTIKQARVGEAAQLVVTVLKSAITFGKKRSLVVNCEDDSGVIELRFFYFSAAQKNKMQPGQRLLVFGDISFGRHSVSIIHPEVKYLSMSQTPPLSKQLTPIYPTTEGVSQHLLRQISDQVLPRLQRGQLQELLPHTLCQSLKLSDLADAIHFVHRPPVGVDELQMKSGEHPAKQRLAIEELIAYNLSLLKLRQKITREAAPIISAPTKLTHQLTQGLPFELTAAQKRVINEIEIDMQLPHPMLRLVQGDVGSGKTLVAAMAALQAIEQGYQVALMAPTEILAEQHWNNFSGWFSDNFDEPILCAFLVSKLKLAEKKQALADIESGEAKMVIGTHALFQESVKFNRLALVIIDEQHRFGVHQRMALRDKSNHSHELPHQLVMTATPIPRTLAMTAYADLDTSVIDELPPGRKPIQTVVLPDSRRDQVIERVATACRDQKVQAYWVCTLIEESEEMQCQAAEQTQTQLQQNLPDLKIELVHGRMKPDDKQHIMEQFSLGHVDVLVATTVIEVGVDVPNASLMVIENPERLGLAQLHQLRGRVGRGQLESHCVLMYHAPLSLNAQARLETMRSTNDGFIIAEKDLELRGPGEVLGTKQTGLVQFKIADVLRDRHLLPQVNQIAKQLIEQYPNESEQLIERWLGNKEHYSKIA